MKRVIKRGLIGLFVIFLIGFTSAASCNIIERSNCSTNNTVMGLSSVDNAHGELYNQGNYDYVLCCDFAGTHTCDGTNKVVGLSSLTNAHAEIPSNNNYANDVCFGDLVCTNSQDSCPSEYTLEIISLSSPTNAHLGNNYDTKICCGVGQGKIAYWADIYGSKIGNDVGIDAHIGETIKLILTDSSLENGTQVTFEIYEEDLIADDEIKTITATSTNGKVVAEWTITQEDYDKGIDLTEQEPDDFYFYILETASNTLTILQEDLTDYCSDYEVQTTCESCDYEGCDAAENSVNTKVFEAYPDEWDDTRCGDIIEVDDDASCTYKVKCSCIWDVDSSPKCTYDWELAVYECDDDYEDGGGSGGGYDNEVEYPTIGMCSYQENTLDNCDDGFLEYSWVATWTWGGNNGYSDYLLGPSEDEEDYVYSSGKWYYDPERVSERCRDGSNVIQCPAEIKLPFFGAYQFAITIFLTMIIYMFIMHKQKRR